MKNFFNPRSIAIVGATDKKGKVGRVVAENILKLGYGGKVFLVNPKHKVLFWKKCYPSLEEIKEKVDLAIIIVPAQSVADVVRSGAEVTKNFVVISAGFSEIGEVGKKREEELKKIAEEQKLSILGPNCLGFIVPSLGLNASFAGGMPEKGNVAFVSQSGALAVALADMAGENGLGFSKIASIGNQMQIEETEMLEYLARDKDTKVIGLYLEGIKNGARFVEVAQRVCREKPVVVLKAGRSEKSQKAIISHTGALAGSDEITSAVFEKAGILRANNLEEFFNLLNLISRVNAPINNKAAIITNAGGAGVITADAFTGKEIKLAEFGKETLGKLKKVLPEESALENPIDLLGDAEEIRYKKTLNIVDKEEIGTVICILTPQHQTPVEKIAAVISDFKKKTGKLVISVFMGGKRVEEAVVWSREKNIPNFSFPEQTVEVLNSYYNWSVSKPQGGQSIQGANRDRKKKVADIIEKAKSENRTALFFVEAERIVKMYGINTVETYDAGNLGSLKFPAAAKVDSSNILHKTEKRALILDIKSPKELEEAIAKLKADFAGENIVVQPMLERDTELILGIKRDEVFGPVIVFGLGGIYTEVFKLVDFLIPPASIEEVKFALSKSKIGFLFKGIRGRDAHNINEISGILAGLSSLALECPEIKEFDINPLLVYNDGRKAVAVDIKIII